MKDLSLKSSMAKLEDAIITISGPALAISGIIAGVDLVTGGHVLQSVSWLALVWAITLLLTLDFQVLALGVRCHRVYTSQKSGGRKALEIVLMVAIAAAISFVSIQMQSIIARVNAETVTIDQAAIQLGINMVLLIWERSTLVLVLIFMSGWLREHDQVPVEALAPAPVPLAPPASTAPDWRELLHEFAKMQQTTIETVIERTMERVTITQAPQVMVSEQPANTLQLPSTTTSHLTQGGEQNQPTHVTDPLLERV